MTGAGGPSTFPRPALAVEVTGRGVELVADVIPLAEGLELHGVRLHLVGLSPADIGGDPAVLRHARPELRAATLQLARSCIAVALPAGVCLAACSSDAITLRRWSWADGSPVAAWEATWCIATQRDDTMTALPMTGFRVVGRPARDACDEATGAMESLLGIAARLAPIAALRVEGSGSCLRVPAQALVVAPALLRAGRRLPGAAPGLHVALHDAGDTVRIALTADVTGTAPISRRVPNLTLLRAHAALDAARGAADAGDAVGVSAALARVPDEAFDAGVIALRCAMLRGEPVVDDPFLAAALDAARGATVPDEVAAELRAAASEQPHDEVLALAAARATAPTPDGVRALLGIANGAHRATARLARIALARVAIDAPEADRAGAHATATAHLQAARRLGAGHDVDRAAAELQERANPAEAGPAWEHAARSAATAPERATALLRAAEAYLAGSSTAAALRCAREATEADARDPAVHEQAAAVGAAAHDTGWAVAAWDTALALHLEGDDEAATRAAIDRREALARRYDLPPSRLAVPPPPSTTRRAAVAAPDRAHPRVSELLDRAGALDATSPDRGPLLAEAERRARLDGDVDALDRALRLRIESAGSADAADAWRLVRADARADSGDLASAIALLDDVAPTSPAHVGASLRRARWLLASGAVDGARAHVEGLLAALAPADPEREDALRVLVALPAASAAEAHARRAALAELSAARPGDRETRRALRAALTASGDHAGALNDARRELALRLGVEPAHAVAAALASVTTEPDIAAVVAECVPLLARGGDDAAAEDAVRALRTAGAEMPEALEEAARGAETAGLYRVAAEAWEALAELVLDDDERARLHAHAERQRRRVRGRARPVGRDDADAARAAVDAVDACQRTGDHEAALDLVAVWLPRAVSPSLRRALLVRQGRALLALGRPHDASLPLKGALLLDDEAADVHVELATLAIAQGDADRAAEHVARAEPRFDDLGDVALERLAAVRALLA